MATIINTTPAQGHAEDVSSNSGMNLIMGILAVVLIAFLLYYFGLPLMRSTGTGGASAPQAPQAPQQINNQQNMPPQGNGAPNVNVPDKVNVNLNTPQNPQK